MNAAGRLVHQGSLYRYIVITHLFSRKQVIVFLLSIAILFSLLSTIYVTHLTRVLHATIEKHVQEQDHLHIEQGQLLLERSTWMMQSRIEQIAEKKLGMVIPNNKSVVIVKE